MALLSATAYKGVATCSMPVNALKVLLLPRNVCSKPCRNGPMTGKPPANLRMRSGVFYSGSAVRMIRHDHLRVGRIVAWRQTSTGLERALMPPVESVEDLHQQLMATTRKNGFSMELCRAVLR